MARLPKIGNGTLVGPEQVLLLHKPGANKRQRVDTETKNDQHDEIVFKKKKGINDWWRDPNEVGREVQQKTARRLEADDLNAPVNKFVIKESVNKDDHINSELNKDAQQKTPHRLNLTGPISPVNKSVNREPVCKNDTLTSGTDKGAQQRVKRRLNTDDTNTPMNKCINSLDNDVAVSSESSTESEEKTTPCLELEVKPSNPEVKPSKPEVNYSRTQTKPSRPEVKPSRPEVKPSRPEITPSRPEVKPSRPEVKPSRPEITTSRPEVKPTRPEVKPSRPKITPSRPEVKPLKPGVKTYRPSVKFNPQSDIRTGKTVDTDNDKNVRFDKASIKPIHTTKSSFKQFNHNAKPKVVIFVPNEPDAKTDIYEESKHVFHAEPTDNTDFNQSPRSTTYRVRSKPNRKSVHARVRKARERARNWTQTCSDREKANNNINTSSNSNVGPDDKVFGEDDVDGDVNDKKNRTVQIKAIHNDSVLRGRPNEPRRGRTFNEIPRPRPAPEPSERQKIIDRNRRIQPPQKRETNASGPEPRSVATAPAKEQTPKSPMPQTNAFVTQEDDDDEPVKPSPRIEKPTQPKQDSVPLKVPEAVKTSPKTEPQKQKPVMPPHKKQDDALAEEKEEEKRNHRHSKLPPDDHGPVIPPPSQNHFTQPAKESKPPVESKQQHDENFKYYASEKPQETQKHESPKVPPLHINSDNKTEKSGTTRTTNKAKSTDYKSQSSSYPPSKSERSKTVDISKSPSTEFSDGPKKRREVTIVDPRSVPPGDEPFLDEYVFGNNDRHKNFDEMDDEEKADYFRNTLKMRPDQIRELTFHPKVNEAKVIHNTYAGSDLVNWKAPNSARGKSAKGRPSKITKVYKKVQTVEPYKRKSFMLSRLQGVIYKHINKVYGNSPRQNREKHFFQKLAQIQMDDYRRRYNQLEEQEKKWLESNYRQRQQLHHVRKKFEDDAWRRFMTQYVTSKVLEAEYKDREEYGLPNNVSELATQSRPKREPISKSPYKQAAVNKKKYKTMFKFTGGPALQKKEENLKFDGYDPAYADTEDDQGNPSPKRKTVEDIMREAKQILNQSDDSDIDEPSPVITKKPTRPSRFSDRKALSEKYERPARHRSREWRQSERGSTPSHRSKSRSKSRNRPAPKTIKDVIDKKRKKDSSQVRYKASNFESMKKDLIKDSALLDKSMKKKKEKNPKERNEIDQVAKSNEAPNVEPKEEESKPDDQQDTEVPSSPQKTTVVTTTTTTTTTTKTYVTDGQPDSDGKVSKTSYDVNQRVSNYLDNTETQMGLESARENVEIDVKTTEVTKESPQSKSPERKPGSVTKPTAADNASIRGTPSRIAVSRTSVRSKNTPDLNVGKQPSRAPSRLSVANKNVNTTNNDTKLNRAPSRLSVANKNVHATNNDTKLNRAPSRLSIQSKQNEEVAVNNSQPPKAVSRAPSRLSIQSVYGKYENKTVARRNSNVSQQTPENGSVQNGRVSRASISKTKQPHDKDSVNTNNTGRISRTSQKIGNKDIVASENEKNKKVSPVMMNGDVQSEKQNGGEMKTADKDNKIMNGSPVVNGKHYSPSPVVNGNSAPSPTVKTEKQVHVSDVVNEVVQQNRIRERKPVTKSESTKRESRPKAPKGKPIRARSPPGRHGKINGYNDSKVRSDDYERKGQGRATRPRRRSGSRGRSGSKGRRRSSSRSRERKRSVSRDRKGQPKHKTKSRFPEIDKSGRLSSLSNEKDKSKTKRSVNVQESVTERELTPTSEGPKQWKDLVQKYLRQPSPKVGKTNDRALLEAPLDTEDEDDDIDIFERAKKRYLLDSDDESI